MLNLDFYQVIFYIIMIVKKTFFHLFWFKSNKILIDYNIRYLEDPLTSARIRNEWLSDGTGFFINKKMKVLKTGFLIKHQCCGKFHLHSFEHLNNVKSFEEGIKIINDWIKNHIPDPNISWHPYNISIRICNMIWFLSSFQSKLSKEVEDIYASLIHQTYFLESHLEKKKVEITN